MEFCPVLTPVQPPERAANATQIPASGFTPCRSMIVSGGSMQRNAAACQGTGKEKEKRKKRKKEEKKKKRAAS